MYNRHVYLGEWSEVGVDHRCTHLTPNENAARRLGVDPLSLEILAQQVLGDDRSAHPVKVQRLLRRAVEEVLGSTDPDGLARVLLPPSGSSSAPAPTSRRTPGHRGRGV
jgi:hypothetical protein